MPEVIVVDTGTEFRGYFAEIASSHGCALLPTDARAPWQNGRTERAGKEWKRQVKLARRKEEPQSEDEFVALAELCCSVRNRYNRRFALDNRTRQLVKVMRARHRTPQTFTEGQMVFVWRQPRVAAGRWHGPGVIVLPTAGGAWVNMLGSLWRVSNEQLRGATSDESLAAEVVNRYLGDMRQDLRNNCNMRRFVDVTREGPPRFPADPDIAEEEEPDADVQNLPDSEPEAEEADSR